MRNENLKNILKQLNSQQNSAKSKALSNPTNNTPQVLAEATQQTTAEIYLNGSNIDIQSYSSSQFEEGGNPINSEVFAGYTNGTYLYSICRINTKELADYLNVELSSILFGKLVIEEMAHAIGNDVAIFVNTSGAVLATAGENKQSIELDIADFYNTTNGFIEFLVAPANENIQGYIHFFVTSMKIIYDGQVSSIQITQIPTKTTYLQGEYFNAEGIKILATDVNGKLLNNLTQRECSISGELDSNFNDEQINTVTNRLLNIQATLGEKNQKIATTSISTQVYPVSNVYYGDTSIPVAQRSSLQTMDIHIPENEDGSYKQGTFPVVITIHGGRWCIGNRSHYDYMTDFITKTCGCIHVNMDYRLMQCDLDDGGNIILDDNGTPTFTRNTITYRHMLEDINNVINYLSINADVYHIDASKIALMGYSAGGHLALLYAYKAAAGHTINDKDMRAIQLVISEAGPLQFASKTVENGNTSYDYVLVDESICAMAGIPYNSENNNYSPQALEILATVSPYCVAQDFDSDTVIPYTILAYGTGISSGINSYEEYNGDGYVPIQPAEELDKLLNTNNDETTDNFKCSLFKLNDVGHNDFGAGSGDKVIPETQVEDNELRSIINDYYYLIETKLTSTI